MNQIQNLIHLLDRKTKRHLLWLVIFSIVVSVVETVGISAIMPFVDISINFKVIQTNPYYQWAFTFFGFKSDVNFAIIFGVTLIGFYIFRGGVNWLYSYTMAYFTEHIYAHTTQKLFKTYLAMPYQIFVKKNSSYLTKAIITEASIISDVIRSALSITSEIFIVIFLYLLMLIASWKITLIFTIIFMIKVFFLTQTISKKIKAIGKIRTSTYSEFYEIINRVFGNFKQIKLQDKTRLQNTQNNFFLLVKKYAQTNVIRSFLDAFPKLFLETSGFILVILLLITLLYVNQTNISYILPTLSLFVLAMYRLLPSINRIVNEYNVLMYNYKTIDIIDQELKTPQENLQDKAIIFNHQLELTSINFSYQQTSVLEDISLTINKGEKVAFVGESGAGKSTLVDLIIGLYQPNQGTMKVDDVIVNESNLQNWRSQIGYIPQQIYLFDGTVADNICFGRTLDHTLLEKVLKQANIFDFLQTKEGTDTLVGEGGIQLSGGQKQRVAIARALYGEPEVLVLDEATSALDEQTEQKIMDEIYKISKDKTLIIVAHRLSTIKGCDKRYEIKNGMMAC